MGLIVGIDLGGKSKHDALVIRRETARQVGKAFGLAIRVRDEMRCSPILRKYVKTMRPSNLSSTHPAGPGSRWLP